MAVVDPDQLYHYLEQVNLGIALTLLEERELVQLYEWWKRVYLKVDDRPALVLLVNKVRRCLRKSEMIRRHGFKPKEEKWQTYVR